MFWECLALSVRESDVTEYRQHALSTKWEDENFKRSLYFTEEERPIKGGLHPEYEHMLERWYTIVQQYTTLNITVSNDALPAISGIANEMHRVTGCQYIAGLWFEDLHRGLLWYRDRECRPSATYVAPTWSWATRHGPIRWLDSDPITLCKNRDIHRAEIIDTFINLVGLNAFGGIDGGHLQLKAYTKQVWYTTVQGEPPFNDPYLGLILNIFDSDGLPIGTGYLDDLTGSNVPVKAIAVLITDRIRLVLDDDGEVDSDPVSNQRD